MWKNEKGSNKTEEGKMFGPINEYAVSVPKTQTLIFGKLVSRYRAGVWGTYLKSGPAMMETHENIIIGHLNDAKMWINGRLEIDKETKIIIYRKYDDEGNKVDRSTKSFIDFEWSNSENRQPAQERVSDIHHRIDRAPMQHDIQKKMSFIMDTSQGREKKDFTDLFEIQITVKGQANSSKKMSRDNHDIPI
jgi:hypothetical protein